MARMILAWGGLALALTIGAVAYLLPNCNLAQAGSGTCRIQCKAAYGACYASTGGDRKLCDQRYQSCLEGCLRSNSIN